jgi:hypothetical protein
MTYDKTNDYYYLKMLERKKDEYISFINHNPQSIIDINDEGIILSMNISFMNIFNYKYIDKRKHISIFDMLDEKECDKFLNIMYKCKNNIDVADINKLKIKTFDGTEKMVITYCTNSSNNKNIFTFILIDITRYENKYDEITNLLTNNLNLRNLKEIIFEYNSDNPTIFNMTDNCYDFFNVSRKDFDLKDYFLFDLICENDINLIKQDIHKFDDLKIKFLKQTYLLNCYNRNEQLIVYLMPVLDNDNIIGIRMLII